MKKIKNNSSKLLLLGVDGFNVDLQPNQEIVVTDRFMEDFKSCLSKVEDISMPAKTIIDPFGKRVEVSDVKDEPKDEVKKSWNKKELESLSFSELKEMGKELRPEVTDRSKAGIIKELLVRLNEG